MVTYSPDALRFCISNILASVFLFSFNAFSTVFSVLIITFQSLLQLYKLSEERNNGTAMEGSSLALE